MAPPQQRDNSENQASGSRLTLKSTQAPISAGNYAAMQNLTTLETYLLANGYTQAALDKMTKNDKIMAYRNKIGTTLAP